MDNYIQGLPIGDTVLTTWTLKFPLTNHWTWEKHSAPSFLEIKESKDDRKALHIANCPVSSIDSQNHLITSLTITEYERKHEQGHWGVTGFCTRSALTWMAERSWSGLLLKVATQRYLQLSLTAAYNSVYNFDTANSWKVNLKGELHFIVPSARSWSSTFKSLSDEEVVDEDDENWKWVFPDEVGNE
uniref:Uncharacterized protein n=1 Tax=Oryza barthii TaxID=65489 RepID=A0A0D3H3U1_9ORYZ